MPPLFTSGFRQHLHILFTTTKASFKLRNENSYLGVFWYLLGPLLTFLVLLIVFSGRLGGDVEHYPLYLLCGIIVWNFFSQASSRSLNAVMSQASLIKSLPIRRDVLVHSVVIDVFVSHLFELVIFLALALYYGALSPMAFLFPVILLLQFFFVLGVGLALSALYFIFRDLGEIWSVLMRAWWFATPIFYVLNEGGPGEKVSIMNPLFHSIELSRDVLVYGELPNIQSLVIFAGFAVVAYLVGALIFSRISPRFAEYV